MNTKTYASIIEPNDRSELSPFRGGRFGSSFQLNRKETKSALLEVSTSDFSQPARLSGQVVWYDYLAAHFKSQRY